ncbi:hypothetical protein BA1_18342 [Bacillus xiamenensis]|nr:hypothetical protein BA1_18342 [Bacillus xiamenensis]
MASKFGVSANPKKANHILGKDKVVVVAMDLAYLRIQQKQIIKSERIRSYELRCKTTTTLVLVQTLFLNVRKVASG